MKRTILLFALLWSQQKLFAQTVGNVGINTFFPDPSAVLDVQATNKGVLLPRIFLQSWTDATTVPNPENGLLLYNTNDGLFERKGLYFNSGTPASPFWENVENNLVFPFTQTGNSTGSLFSVRNTGLTSGAIGIRGSASTGQGIVGVSSAGTGLWGFSNETGTGISATSSNGVALEINGKLKITGANVAAGSGKVLTALDAAGNAHWATPNNEYDDGINGFQATGILGGGSQNMSENTFIKIAFANQIYDFGGNYNDVNMSPHSSFITPKKGIYHFDVMLQWENVDYETPFGPAMKLVRIRGGVTTELSESRSWSSNGRHVTHIAIDCALEPGDQINVIARAYAPQVALGMDNGNAHFNGHLTIEL